MEAEISVRTADAGVARVVQLTDPHISADPGKRFAGVDTAASLRLVLAAILDGLPAPDCLLLTGDLVNEPGLQGYERLLEILGPLPMPVFCLAGNHDEPDMMRAVLNRGANRTPHIIDCGAWRIILLESFVPGHDGGALDPAELALLESALSGAGERYALVCLHHPPVSINSPWMDRMGLGNPAEMFAVLDRFPRVRGVVWGHIHQEFAARRSGIQLLGTPSTCVQFAANTQEFRIDSRPPGFRELTLHGDGRLETRVQRVR